MGKSRFSLKVRLLLEREGEMLLLKQTTKNGGNYTLPGGAVEYKENPLGALVREIQEEVGVKINPGDLELFHTLHKRKKDERRITLYFKTSRWTGVVRNRERRKFQDIGWHYWKSLPSNLSPTVEHVLKQYWRGNRYSEFG
jgi:8-oxo-dGTP diphosphatase